mmetsp:Transcript_44812/g.140446  ORF Transcript_44812/g.140446 Transcript_44812/m.140446 type:complete len:640 (-) Transcript_44812:306-2225(-)
MNDEAVEGVHPEAPEILLPQARQARALEGAAPRCELTDGRLPSTLRVHRAAQEPGRERQHGSWRPLQPRLRVVDHDPALGPPLQGVVPGGRRPEDVDGELHRAGRAGGPLLHGGGCLNGPLLHRCGRLHGPLLHGRGCHRRPLLPRDHGGKAGDVPPDGRPDFLEMRRGGGRARRRRQASWHQAPAFGRGLHVAPDDAALEAVGDDALVGRVLRQKDEAPLGHPEHQCLRPCDAGRAHLATPQLHGDLFAPAQSLAGDTPPERFAVEPCITLRYAPLGLNDSDEHGLLPRPHLPAQERAHGNLCRRELLEEPGHTAALLQQAARQAAACLQVLHGAVSLQAQPLRAQCGAERAQLAVVPPTGPPPEDNAPPEVAGAVEEVPRYINGVASTVGVRHVVADVLHGERPLPGRLPVQLLHEAPGVRGDPALDVVVLVPGLWVVTRRRLRSAGDCVPFAVEAHPLHVRSVIGGYGLRLFHRGVRELDHRLPHLRGGCHGLHRRGRLGRISRDLVGGRDGGEFELQENPPTGEWVVLEESHVERLVSPELPQVQVPDPRDPGQAPAVQVNDGRGKHDGHVMLLVQHQLGPVDGNQLPVSDLPRALVLVGVNRQLGRLLGHHHPVGGEHREGDAGQRRLVPEGVA